MSDAQLWMGGVASVVHFAATVWWYRKQPQPWRDFGAIVLGGSGVVAAYIVIRTLVER